jgi:hypothetical protein
MRFDNREKLLHTVENFGDGLWYWTSQYDWLVMVPSKNGEMSVMVWTSFYHETSTLCFFTSWRIEAEKKTVICTWR